MDLGENRPPEEQIAKEQHEVSRPYAGEKMVGEQSVPPPPEKPQVGEQSVHAPEKPEKVVGQSVLAPSEKPQVVGQSVLAPEKPQVGEQSVHAPVSKQPERKAKDNKDEVSSHPTQSTLIKQYEAEQPKIEKDACKIVAQE